MLWVFDPLKPDSSKTTTAKTSIATLKVTWFHLIVLDWDFWNKIVPVLISKHVWGGIPFHPSRKTPSILWERNMLCLAGRGQLLSSSCSSLWTRPMWDPIFFFRKNDGDSSIDILRPLKPWFCSTGLGCDSFVYSQQFFLCIYIHIKFTFTASLP